VLLLKRKLTADNLRLKQYQSLSLQTLPKI
jgi:hypothetical protein